MAERLAHRHDAGRIEPVGRLVEEEQARVAQEGGGDPEPLLHPERIRLDLVPRPIAEPDELEQLLDPALRGRRSGGGERPQVLAAGQVRVEGRRLDERPDLEQPVPVAPAERPAEDLDRTRVGMDQAGEQPHRRRLAGAVRAEEAVHDAGRHGQVQPGEGGPRPVPLVSPRVARASPSVGRSSSLQGRRPW